MKFEYVLASPVKEDSKIFRKWIKQVETFCPRPEKIIVASENDLNAGKDIIFLKCQTPYVPKDLMEDRHFKIGNAREEIRRYILDHTQYNLIFLLDSDVFVNKFAPWILFLLMNNFQAQGIMNNFPDKSGYPPVSLGCTMITRDLFNLVSFYPHGRFSEDSVFISSIMNLGNFGYKFKFLNGKCLDVVHYKEKKEIIKIEEIELQEWKIGYKEEK